MTSPRPGGSRRTNGASNSNTEPFPSMPDSSAGPSFNNNTTTTTTTTTVHAPTVTTTIHRGGPYTITSSQPPTQPQSHQQSPTSAVSAPDPAFSTSSGPTTTRTFLAIPTQTSRNRPISIRRLPSSNLRAGYEDDVATELPSHSTSGRGRATSAPQQPQHLGVPTPGILTRQSTRQSVLPTVAENAQAGTATGVVDRETMNEHITGGTGRRRSVSNTARSVLSRFSDGGSRERYGPEYESDVVDLLDVLDPEVSTLTTLNNVQNSLFVPDLGRWINRRPTYNLSRHSTQARRPEPVQEDGGLAPIPSEQVLPEQPEPREAEIGAPPTMQRSWSWQRRPQVERTHSIQSVITDSHYAVLPHGVSLEGWSQEDKEALDDHVRHMMHSKRSKFKQRMVAFGKYIKKPLGFFIFLYATLITLFGLAWVLFLIGWIYSGNRKDYLTNVIDNILVALFAVMGDGLAPFRIVDTYHMCFIAHYHHKSWRLRRERAMPKLHDANDLPAKAEKETDPEAGKPEDSEFSVLTHKQQQKLIHHQAKFSKSHSFYKPHETGTHYAFPLHLLVAIVCLLDCHSLFQIALGTCTWSISYHTRSQALTATILCCSITCNITAGILISVGDKKTRKKDVALRMQRQALTLTAIEKVEKHKREREQQAEEQARLTGADNRNFEVIDEETTTESGPASKTNSRNR